MMILQMKQKTEFQKIGPCTFEVKWLHTSQNHGDKVKY